MTDRDWILDFLQENIVDARMTEIVNCGRDQHRERFDLIKLSGLAKSAPLTSQEIVNSLADVSSVRLTMIRQILVAT